MKAFELRQKIGITKRMLKIRSLQDVSLLCVYLFGISRLYTFERSGVYMRFFRDPFSFWLARDSTRNTLRADERIVESLLCDRDVCIDVGANIGLISLRMHHKVGKEGIVYSFEPHPNTYKKLIHNLEINNFDISHTFNQAVGNKSDVLRFTDIFISDLNHISEQGEISVPVVKLDDVIPKSIPIKLLKVDAEGYELFVLQGAQHILKNISYIFVEIAPQSFERYGYNAQDVYDFLLTNGFVLSKVERTGELTPIHRDFVSRDKYLDILASKQNGA